MNKSFKKFPKPERRIAYVRPVNVDELPKDIRDQAGDAKKLYAVHDENGAPLAIVAERRLAFALAKENDLAPVHVH